MQENICAVDLRARYGEDKVWFWNRNVEVDFFVPEDKLAVQACYSISADVNTFEREVKALVELDKAQSLDRMVVVTFNEERTLTGYAG